MVEVLTVTQKESIKYKGLLDCSTFYKHLCGWLDNHEYTKNELINEEQVLEEGKQIKIHQEPFKQISDYAKVEMQIDIVFSGLNEVEIEKDGKKQKIDKGDVEMHVETFLITDYEQRWQNKPFYYFTKKILERFFFVSYMEQYKDELREDKDSLMQEMKKFLNLKRFTFEQ